MEKEYAVNERKIRNHRRRCLVGCRKNKKYARTYRHCRHCAKNFTKNTFFRDSEKKRTKRVPLDCQRGTMRRRGLKTINHRRWMLYYVGRYYIDSSTVPDVTLLMPDYDRGFAVSTSICCAFFTFEMRNIRTIRKRFPSLSSSNLTNIALLHRTRFQECKGARTSLVILQIDHHIPENVFTN